MSHIANPIALHNVQVGKVIQGGKKMLISKQDAQYIRTKGVRCVRSWRKPKQKDCGVNRGVVRGVVGGG